MQPSNTVLESIGIRDETVLSCLQNKNAFKWKGKLPKEIKIKKCPECGTMIKVSEIKFKKARKI